MSRNTLPPRVSPFFPLSPSQIAAAGGIARPPASRTQVPAPRLPAMPAPPYAPPVLPVEPPAPIPLGSQQGGLVDYEAAHKTVAIPDTKFKTVDVYSTQRRWRGIDVSVFIPPDFNFATSNSASSIGVVVYGVTRGIRSIVASGRIIAEAAAYSGAFVENPRWVVSARAIAERYDVAISKNFDPGNLSIPQGTVEVSIIESDQAVEREGPWQGSVAWPTIDDSAGAIQLATSDYPLELVWVHAVADIGAMGLAAAWLHVHNSATVAVGGLSPLFSFPLSTATPTAINGGATAIYDGQALRQERFDKGIVLAASSTASFTTLLGANVVGMRGAYR